MSAAVDALKRELKDATATYESLKASEDYQRMIESGRRAQREIDEAGKVVADLQDAIATLERRGIDTTVRLINGQRDAVGGYVASPQPATVRVYDHGDHRSLDAEHPRDAGVLCDYILTAAQIRAMGGADLLKRWREALQDHAPKPPEPVLIERRPEMKTQLLVRGPHGLHRQLQPGELPDAGETPVKSRAVTLTTELWRGVKPGGEILATSDDLPLTKVELDAEYGPWREYR